jgi:hypothetical protein
MTAYALQKAIYDYLSGAAGRAGARRRNPPRPLS